MWIGERSIELNFTADAIVFPKGYDFRYSTVIRRDKVRAITINEVDLSAAPPSLVINSAEVIFISAVYRNELAALAERNGIPQVKRFDIWGALNEPFLDTTHTPEQQAQTIALLAENNIPPAEVVDIRKRIRRTMLFYNSFVWEWVYLGHYDYLRWTWLTKRKYWWSMDIALRNFRP